MSTDAFTLTIDGKAVAGQNTFPVVNPALGKPFAEAPDCTQAQLDDAMSSSATVFLSWRKDDMIPPHIQPCQSWETVRDNRCPALDLRDASPHPPRIC